LQKRGNLPGIGIYVSVIGFDDFNEIDLLSAFEVFQYSDHPANIFGEILGDFEYLKGEEGRDQLLFDEQVDHFDQFEDQIDICIDFAYEIAD
jgi:hypothetical protein